MKKTVQTQIYVGLNDSQTHEQKFDTKKYVEILKNVCKSYHVAFSLHTVSGGYFHEDGSYVDENTLVLSLLDIDENTVMEIAKDLCAFFNQESVMVTGSPSVLYFISEKVDVNN